MSTFVHFDLPANEMDRCKKFYETLFDWKFKHIPEMDYYLIETTGPDGKKGLGGGMSKRTKSDEKIVNYIGVESIDNHVLKIIEMGGKISGPKINVPGWGNLAVCSDTEGNTFGLWEENISKNNKYIK